MELPLMAKVSGLENEEAKEWMIQEINWNRAREVYDEEDYPELPIRSVKNDLMHWYVMPYTHASYSAFWFCTSAICLFFSFYVVKRR